MGASRGGTRFPERPRAGGARGEAGALMMFVLMAMLLVAAITVSAIQIIGADVLGGVRELEADQVYNIAQAGVHYGIGQLQQPNGASTGDHYAGETKTITSGSTTLGTATITVNCVDTTSSNGWAPPCSSSAYPGYRRIIAKGTLPVSGPSRTIVAVVQGTSSGGGSGSWSTAVCGLSTVKSHVDVADAQTTFYGDIVSNGSINMNPSGSSGNISILGDPGSPPNYTGKLSAVGSVTCTSPCSAAGGLFPGQTGPVCSAPTVPAPGYVPGSTPVTVASGTTYTIPSTGGSFSDITLSAGPCAGASPFTTLAIQTSTTDSTATTVVQLNSLTMVQCTRLMVLGVGKVDLRIGASTGMSLSVGYIQKQNVHFGVLSTDTLSTPAPVAASQLTVWVNSNATNTGGDCTNPPPCAVYLTASGSGTIVVPNGTAGLLDHNPTTNPFYGAVLAHDVILYGQGALTSDTSGLSGLGGSATYSNFNTLMSWKDQ